jgi:hypothetical protein
MSPSRPKTRARQVFERFGEFAELGEDEGLFAARGDFFAEFGEAGELGAVGGIVVAGLGELVWMVADLFEAHQVGEDETAPLDSGDFFERLGECPRVRS